MPFAPRTAGTPRQTFEAPYSPSKRVDTGVRLFLSVTMDSIIEAIAFPGAWIVAPFKDITSAAIFLVDSKVVFICSGDKNVVNGIPDIEENLGRGSMFSPCSPITIALMEPREYPVT